MLNRNPFTTARIAGILLLLSLLLLIVGVAQIYMRGKLPGLAAAFRGIDFVTRDTSGLRTVMGFALPAMIAQLAGYGLLTTVLHQAGDRGTAVVALVLFVVGTVFAVIEGIFHAGITVWASQMRPVPEFYEPLRHYINHEVQYVYISFWLTALLLFSWSALRAKALSPWISWSALGWCLLSFVYYFSVFELPAVVFPATLLLGIGLLLRG